MTKFRSGGFLFFGASSPICGPPNVVWGHGSELLGVSSPHFVSLQLNQRFDQCGPGGTEGNNFELEPRRQIHGDGAAAKSNHVHDHSQGGRKISLSFQSFPWQKSGEGHEGLVNLHLAVQRPGISGPHMSLTSEGGDKSLLPCNSCTFALLSSTLTCILSGE